MRHRLTPPAEPAPPSQAPKRQWLTDARRLLATLDAAVIVVAIVAALHTRPTAIGIDFHTYMAAGLVGLHHGWSHIYDQHLVAAAQRELVPSLWTQPFLSPPLVAWIVAPLTLLPYDTAFFLWAAITLGGLAAALAYSTPNRGWSLVLLVGAALVPWWVIRSVQVGQVVPLVAAGVLVAWRLLRDKRDVAAGIALGVVLLKPNTALWAPVLLLATGRVRAFTAWLVIAAGVGILSFATLGQAGVAAYMAELSRLPSGANDLTLNGTLGLVGSTSTLVRVAVVAVAIATAYRLRSTPGLALALGALASLITAPYLHGSDLCVLVAAGWITWHERPTGAWRALLVSIWVFSTPFVYDTGPGALLKRWALAEIVLFVAIAGAAWFGAPVSSLARRALTATGALTRRAPA